MPPYATLEDFPGIVHELMQDLVPRTFQTNTAELLVILNLLLRMYSSPEVPNHATEKLLDTCRRLASAIENRYPDSAGYLDFLMGTAVMVRAGWSE